MVSKSLVNEPDVNVEFFSAIGYPVYANRAIRVDMLDRIISAIYDSAKDGTFKATHAMAEWLGCSIPDLYLVIEAMGHRKVSDPQEQKIAESVAATDAAVAAVETPASEVVTTEGVAEAAPAAETVETPAAPVVAVKPELATFRLRKGKAYGEQSERKPRESKPGEKKPFRNSDKKPFNKDDKRKPRKEGRKPDKFGDRKERERDNREPRVVASAAASSVGESPFSILQQLKTK
jgi:ATP-dependent RNA helicase SUPV3L1/SUV3